MERLYVIYDNYCGLCRWARAWVESQPQFIPLTFVAACSETSRRLFPGLEQTDPPEELVAVSDEGAAYRGGSAYVMVLFALRDYREWSLRLGSPALLPLARQAFAVLSKQRGVLSRWLRLDRDDDALREALRGVDSPSCSVVPDQAAPVLHPSSSTPTPPSSASLETEIAG
jgi:predicted DCC family thiol-disulfide oxidoreductase YuxK